MADRARRSQAARRSPDRRGCRRRRTDGCRASRARRPERRHRGSRWPRRGAWRGSPSPRRRPRTIATTRVASGSRPPRRRLISAGISLRRVRSPPAPKMTITHGRPGAAAPRAAARRSMSSSTWLPALVAGVAALPARGCLADAGAPPTSCRLPARVAAELLAHRRQQLVAEGVILARAEAREQRLGQHRHRHRRLDRRLDRPAAFAGVGHVAGEAIEGRALGERRRRQIEQPRRDDAAAPPHLGDRGDVEVVALPLRHAVLAAPTRIRSKPSAYACIRPYSMPLWTIFTKWPAPAGPQCR